MEFADYLNILWGRRWIVAATIVVTMAVVTVGMILIPPTYMALAVLRTPTATSGSADYVQYYTSFTDRLMHTYAEIATSRPVLDELKQRLNLETLPQVEAKPIESTELLQIVVEGPDPLVARDAANVLADILIERSGEVFAEWDFSRSGSEGQGSVAEPPDSRVYIVEPAVTPTAPSKPNRLLFIAAGLVIGTASGLGLALLIENFDAILYTTRQIEQVTGLAVLGTVPPARKREKVDSLLVAFPHVEAFRRLRTNLFSLSPNGSSRKWLITSAEPGEGKSTVAANLALSIAQGDRTVVCIDADVRRPSLHNTFGLSNTIGLSTVLRQGTSWLEAVQLSRFPGVYVLPSGPTPPNPTELLGSGQMVTLIEHLSRKFDVVLLDAPAFLPVTDAAVLAPLVDGVLMVARRARVRQQALRATCQELARLDVDLAGVVVNQAESSQKYIYEYYRSLKSDQIVQRDQFVSGTPPLSAALPEDAEVVEAHNLPNDSLCAIHGIGPTYEQALNALGIRTFADLARQDPEVLARHIDAYAPAKRIRRDGWIEQARALAEVSEPS